jgi:hypothetical protein
MGMKACMVKKFGAIEAPHNDLLNILKIVRNPMWKCGFTSYLYSGRYQMRQHVQNTGDTRIGAASLLIFLL